MAQRCNRRNPQLRVLFLTLKKCSCIEQISMSSSFGILAKIPGGATFPRPPGPLECGNPECGASAPPRVCCLDLGPSWEYPGFLCPVWWGGCLLPRSLPSSFSLWDVTKSKPQSSGAGSSGNIRQTQRAETVQLHNTLSRGHRVATDSLHSRSGSESSRSGHGGATGWTGPYHLTQQTGLCLSLPSPGV